MATKLGPKTSAQDRVIFAFDLGDFNQSYFGEPSTNTQDADKSAMTQAGFDAWGCYDTVGYPALPPHVWGAQQSKSLVTVTGPFGKPVNAMLYHNFTGDFHAPTDWGAIPSGMITAGRTYTVQGWVKAADSESIGRTVNAHTYYSHSAGAYSNGTNYTLTDEWQLVSHTHTAQYTASGGGIMYFFTSNPGPVKMFLTMTGVIFDKPHPVQWLLGGTTRTSTQSLFDIKTQTSINTNTVSFNNSALITYDGTDDLINAGSNPVTQFGPTTDQFSIELVYRVPASPSKTTAGSVLSRYRYNLNHIYSGNYFSFDYVNKGYDDTGSYSSTNITTGLNPTGQWNHIIISYTRIGDASALAIWANGQLRNSSTSTRLSTYPLSNLFIGHSNHLGGTYYDFEGDINLIRVYNKALTSDEMANNHKALQKRFNL